MTASLNPFKAPTSEEYQTTATSFIYGFSDDGGVADYQDYFTFSELFLLPDSSPSPDSPVIDGSGPGFAVPGSVPGFINPPADFPFVIPMQSPLIFPSGHYTSSSSKEACCNSEHQLFTMTSPSQENLEVSESRKGKRLMVVDRPKSDGYKWRKYGQKPIKDSKFSRSYYKCTHPNCAVKKKVQNSKAGRVTHVIYTGEHNHDQLPQPSSVPTDSEDSADAYMRFEDDEEVEPCVQGSTYEEAGSSETTTTGPKIVVQTTSEVELLDDGYKWRKYGQKVVKGNCNPRSYYKCTSSGCGVRKQVERSSKKPEDVITTYEGKHNHDVPAGRNSSIRSAQQVMLRDGLPSFSAEIYSGHREERVNAFLRLKEE